MSELPVPRCYPEGPQPSKVLIVGEAPGYEEIRQGKPFVGSSGEELTRMLHDSGLIRAECRITNVTPFRPEKNEIKTWFFTKTEAAKRGAPYLHGRYPSKEILQGLQELKEEIAKTRPKTIIALGDTALWALTGESGISKWRGSELLLKPVWEGPYDPSIRVIPTYHPAAILRAWDWRAVACYDLARAANPAPEAPDYHFRVAYSFPTAKFELLRLRSLASQRSIYLSCDIETRERKLIDCIGFAWSATDALCVPFLRASDYSFLYSPEEEAELILLIRDLLLHPNVQVIGQNFFYDAQYIARLWGFLPIPAFDTMIAHAVAYPGTQKSLDYLSSIYLHYHRYWKGESGEAEITANDQQRWEYNCKDCCSTWALREPLEETLRRHELEKPFQFEMGLFRPLLSMMLRGTRQANQRRGDYMQGIMAQQVELESFFEYLSEEVFHDLPLAKSKTAKPWYRSPSQQVKLFYDYLRLPVQVHKKTKRPTMDDKALEALKQKDPLFLPIFQALSDYRSLGVFLSTFVLVKLDSDGRMRCSYNPVGTETFRFNSSEDVFGFGGNLQNIPVGTE